MTSRYPHRNWRQRLRVNFLTGLIVLAPVVVTGYVVWYLFTTIDGWLAGALAGIPWLEIDGKPAMGAGFISVILIILATGVVARNVVGVQLLRLGDRVLARIPLVRGVYTAVKQISEAFFGTDQTVFRQVVLVPFPTRGIYTVGFLTSNAPSEAREKTGEDMVSVFLPTSPNPTSGYLLMAPRRDVIEMDMTVEEAMKLVISGGTVVPPGDGSAVQVRPV
jgi:uncharacterized membrane protein